MAIRLEYTRKFLKMDVLAFTTQLKARCATWYIETQFTTTVGKRWQTKYAENCSNSGLNAPSNRLRASNL